MNKRIVVAICLVALATSAFAINARVETSNALQPHVPQPSNIGDVPDNKLATTNRILSSSQQQQTVPEHAVYNELFYHVSFLKKKADKEQKEGKDASLLRTFYKRQAKLDDTQNQLLDQTAADLERDVNMIDKKAQKVIEKFRADVQKLKIKPGDRMPEPPAELKTMQAERDSLVIRARDTLRAALGKEAFQRFDQYVRENIAKKMTAERFDRPRPENPNRPR